MTEHTQEALRERIAGLIWDSTWNAPNLDEGDVPIPWDEVRDGDSATADHFDDEVFRCRHLADRILALLSPLQEEREPAKALSDGINLADVLVWLQNRPGGSWKATISDIGKAVSGIKADRTERALHPQEVPE